MNLHNPPDLSCHQRRPSARSSHRAHATAATPVCRPPHNPTPCVCATGTPHHQPCGHFSNPTRPHLASLTTALHLSSSPHSNCPSQGPCALAGLPRLLTESLARQPRSNATGLATLIVSAPDNLCLCLVGQVQAVQPRPLPAIPVPICLT